jgi:hypothetical protein
MRKKKDMDSVVEKELEKLEMNILDISKDAYDLLKTYKQATDIKNFLEKIKYKDVEGYGHLSDVNIINIGSKYFEMEVYTYYLEIEDWFRNHESLTQLAKRFNVDRTVVAKWALLDSQLNHHIKQGRRIGVLGAKSVLGNMMVGFIDPTGEYHPPHFGALRLYLLNAASDEFKDEKTINTNNNSDVDLKVNKLIDGMSDEELRKLLEE